MKKKTQPKGKSTHGNRKKNSKLISCFSVTQNVTGDRPAIIKILKLLSYRYGLE